MTQSQKRELHKTDLIYEMYDSGGFAYIAF